jgi:hypothetical protein
MWIFPGVDTAPLWLQGCIVYCVIHRIFVTSHLIPIKYFQIILSSNYADRCWSNLILIIGTLYIIYPWRIVCYLILVFLIYSLPLLIFISKSVCYVFFCGDSFLYEGHSESNPFFYK